MISLEYIIPMQTNFFKNHYFFIFIFLVKKIVQYTKNYAIFRSDLEHRRMQKEPVEYDFFVIFININNSNAYKLH